MYLNRLIYYSVNQVQKLDLNVAEEIRKILAVAQQRNYQAGISGALLFNQNYFVQVLEGDRKAVTETFCRIARDPRHGGIVVLDVSPIEERMFLNWSMGLVGNSETASQLVKKYSVQSDKFLPQKMSAKAMLSFVAEMVEKEKHVAGGGATPRVFRAEQSSDRKNVVLV